MTTDRIVLNTLADLIYCATTGAMKPKAVARYLELLAVELADQGADDTTVATVAELAARIRHAKHLSKVAAERRTDREVVQLRPVA